MTVPLEVIKTEQIQHRADTQGVVITEIQHIRNADTGEVRTVNFWRDWQTQKLIRVE